MATNYLKPQEPLHKLNKETGDINYIYPVTTADQVILDDDTRLSAKLDSCITEDEVSIIIENTVSDLGAITIDLEETINGNPSGINADTFGGYSIDRFVMYGINEGEDGMAGDGVDYTVDADTLGGVAAEDYALKSDLENIKFDPSEFESLLDDAALKTGCAFTGAISAPSISSSGNITATGNITGAKVYGAVFNDYAEFFPRGEETEAGDLIALDLGSEEEKYVKASKENPIIVGVHSNEYAHLIGGEIPPEGEDFVNYNIDKYIPVGLMGRCHVKVIGSVKKGDLITISNIPGIGQAVKERNINETVIGYAVESKLDENIKLVKVVLRG